MKNTPWWRRTWNVVGLFSLLRRLIAFPDQRSHDPARKLRTRLLVEQLEPLVMLNGAPVAVNDGTFNVVHGHTLNDLDLLVNDTYTDPAAVSIGIEQPPTKGFLSYNSATGRYDYTADSWQTGSDLFRYRLHEGGLESDPATVLLQIDNTAPVAAPHGPFIMPHGQSHTGINLFADSDDEEGDSLTFSIQQGPTKGWLSWDATTGTYDYHSYMWETGPDNFAYILNDGAADSLPATVSLLITNTLPVAADHGPFSVPHGQTYVGIDLFDDSHDEEGDPLTFSLQQGPTKGWLSWDPASSTYDYHAYNWESGPDSFTYVLNDGAGDSNEATVWLLLTNSPPEGTNRSIVISEDTPHIFSSADFGFSDPGDSSPHGFLSVKIATPPPGYMLTKNASPVNAGDFVSVAEIDAGSLMFTPAANATGASYATFTFQVRDDGGGDDLDLSANTITFDVTPANDAPISQVDVFYTIHQGQTLDTAASGVPSVLANDTDAEGSTLLVWGFSDVEYGLLNVFDNGHFIYRPDPGFVGLDGFSYAATDGFDEGLVVNVQVLVTNADELANDDWYSGVELIDTLAQGLSSLFANDTDGNLDTLSLVDYTQPAHGFLSISATGHFVYVPDPGTTSDEFTYTITDGASEDTATVSVNMTAPPPAAPEPPPPPPPPAPTPQPDTYTVPRNGRLDTLAQGLPSLFANDFQPGDAVPELMTFGQPTFGHVTVDPDGFFVYTPTPSNPYTGPDSFTYILTDGQNTTVGISITNDPPTAEDDGPFGLVYDQEIVIPSVLDNDTDANNDALVPSLDEGCDATAGTVYYDSSRPAFVFEPAANYFGPVSFTYTVSDGLAASAPATVDLHVVGRLTWTGDGDARSWTDPANWNPSIVPGPNTEVFIPAGDEVDLDAADASIIYALDLQGQLNLNGTLSLNGPSWVSGSGHLELNGQLTLGNDADLEVVGTAILRSGVNLAQGSITVPLGGSLTLQNATLSGAGGLLISGGTVTVAGVNSVGSTYMDSGTLRGAGDFNINQLFFWSGGAWEGPGTTHVAANALLSIVERDVSLGRTLNNQGYASLTGPARILANAGPVTIENLQNASFVIADDGDIRGLNNLTFNNAGTLTKLGGTDSIATIDQVLFSNTGSLGVLFGKLVLDGNFGSGSSAFTVFSGATMEFAAGTFILDASSTLSGDGSVSFLSGWKTINGLYQVYETTIDGAQVDFNGNASSNQLTLRSGTLSGTGALDIADAFYWYGGLMTGGGQTILGTAAESFISEAGAQRAQDRIITNYGRVYWSEGADLAFLGQVAFTNLGEFDAFDGTSLTAQGSSNYFVNAGTFVRTDYQGSGVTRLLGVTFVNTGTVRIDTGSLTLTQGSSTGQWVLSDGVSLIFQTGLFLFVSGGFTYDHSANALGFGLSTYQRFYGTIIVEENATLTILNTLDVANLEFHSGEISGAGTLRISNPWPGNIGPRPRMVWIQGAMVGSGTTEIASDATLYLIGPNGRYLGERWLNIYGKTGWMGRGAVMRLTPTNASQEFINPTGATGAPNQDATDWEDVPLHNGGGSASSMGTTMRTFLVNPPAPLPVPHEWMIGPNRPLSVIDFLHNTSAIDRLVTASAYYRLYGVELRDDIPQHLSSAQATHALNCLQFGETTNPNQPASNSLSWKDVWNMARGTLAGLASGAWDAISGVAQFVWNLVWSPIKTVTGIRAAISTLVGLVGDGRFMEAAQLVAPDLYHLITQWPLLSPYDKGFHTGKVVGQFAAQGGMGAGSAAAVSAAIGRLPNIVRSAGGGLVQRLNQLVQQIDRTLSRVRGIDILKNNLQHPNYKKRWGAMFQAERALFYARQGLLSGIEEGMRASRRVVDLILNSGWRVECKAWTGWHRWGADKTKGIRDQFKRQVEAYLGDAATGTTKLLIEFKDLIPPPMTGIIGTLSSKYGSRLIVATIS